MSDQTQDSSGEALAGSSEPSMEDILASIRRIIAEDEGEELIDDATAGDAAASDASALNNDDDATLLVLDEPLDAGEDAFDPLDLEIPDIEAENAADPQTSLSDDDDILEVISEHEELTIDVDDTNPAGELISAKIPASEDDNIIDLVLDDINLTDDEVAEAGSETLDVITDESEDIEDILIIESDEAEPVSVAEDVIDDDMSLIIEETQTDAPDLVDDFLGSMAPEKPHENAARTDDRCR